MLAVLAARYPDPLDDRIDVLALRQKQEIAAAVMANDFVSVQNTIRSSIGGLERCLRSSGYERCTGGCDEWFPELELSSQAMCEDCEFSDQLHEIANEVPPEEEGPDDPIGQEGIEPSAEG